MVQIAPISHPETRLYIFLSILDAMGGTSDASDTAGSWVNAFCEEHENRDPDTFNLAEQRGYTRISHCTSFDISTVRLTDEGRTFLNEVKVTLALDEGLAYSSGADAIKDVRAAPISHCKPSTSPL